MALRVKVQPSYNQSSVIRLSEDPNLIKTILDQIVIFQLDSVSASHISFTKFTLQSVADEAPHPNNFSKRKKITKSITAV
ncbi:hypothetical protein Lal_00040130 [Lupinus albus]|nr:hypothetical protein Lal_00040130 [Lupinus albus]